MKKKKQMRTPDKSWLDLRQTKIFQNFFRGFLELLQKRLQRIEVKGKLEYSYYTCGKPHDKRNPDWKPWQYLWDYCELTGYDFFETRDMIEERIGRKLHCECELVRDDKSLRRMELERMFGVDFGAPGRKELDVV